MITKINEWKLIKESSTNQNALNSDVIKTIVQADKFNIEIGSGTSGISWDVEPQRVLSFFIEFINQYFFDADFYYNWTEEDEKKKYKEHFKTEILNPFLDNLDAFVEKYMTIKDVFHVKNAYALKPEFNDEFFEQFIIDHIINSAYLKQNDPNRTVRTAYVQYRWEYAGEQVDPEYAYAGTWPDNTVQYIGTAKQQ